MSVPWLLLVLPTTSIIQGAGHGQEGAAPRDSKGLGWGRHYCRLAHSSSCCLLDVWETVSIEPCIWVCFHHAWCVLRQVMSFLVDVTHSFIHSFIQQICNKYHHY